MSTNSHGADQVQSQESDPSGLSRVRNLLTDRGLLRLQALQLRFTQSLFFIPALMVLLSLVLSQITVWLDGTVSDELLPEFFQTTVESSRAILSAIAGGTITAASIVFSLTLVAVQLAASQFSPRVLQGFLGDRFQQIVMGTVVGTFAFSVLVLREVSGPGEENDAFIPQLSIALALVLAMAALIAILASIDHTAKGLRVGSVADGIMDQTLRTIEELFPPRSSDDEAALLIDAPGVSPAPVSNQSPPESARIILAPRSGWVTGFQASRITEVIEEGSTALVTSAVGTYVVEGTPMAHIWPCSEERFDGIVKSLHEIVRIDDFRSMQQDVGFGLVQLNDISLRALSPGVNDPNTAIEVIVRSGAIITELYRRKLTPKLVTKDGRTVTRPHEPSYCEYVELAFEPTRRYGRTDHQVLAALARAVFGVIEDGRRRFESIEEEPLWRQIELISEEAEPLPDADRESLRTVLEPLLSLK